ncbi:MAG: hypothetical protein KVP17_000372 [Porospora cf. gigantea B]|uniref:uncharacterized protein n=1 Tax=Porospora cf. gigantea B TaxID=2853592 RepID=UPI003571EF21|nr:MAG: hypothetical protein KVP17_000372 [Porospora cf. gigantea B]
MRQLPVSRVEELEDIHPQKLDRAQQHLEEIQNVKDCNAVYQKCFQLLKLGGLEAEIPRLVVFGQQSMGKTTLLDFIMGGPIGYSSTTTGTKMPVVIMLRPPQGNEDRARPSAMCKGQHMSIDSLQHFMSDVMIKQGDKITAEELDLEIVVPDGVHAVFVDLPGIKDDSKDGAEVTRNVVRTYVSNNPNDLYILVKKASDDPANWPWSLREFIISPAPVGLGLSPKQTLVVGTRARDFLTAEKNDIKTQDELVLRVRNRAVKDQYGTRLPLHLLELFSLSMSTKESKNFQLKKAEMLNQIRLAQRSCLSALTKDFEYSRSQEVRRDLRQFFDIDHFKTSLNVKFQSLLSEQITLLERRLVKKRNEIEKEIERLSRRARSKSPQSVREAIRLFVRELLQTVTDLVTGNYMILRLAGNGDEFLAQYGGNLHDNLTEGHQLALELFPKETLYDPEFLSKIQEQTVNLFENAQAERTRLLKTQQEDQMHSEAARAFTAEKPAPEPLGFFQPGQLVRYSLSSQKSSTLGFIKRCGAGENTSQCEVAMFFQTTQNGSVKTQLQVRMTDKDRLAVVVPLTHIARPSSLPPAHQRCWRRTLRPDGWVGVVPVEVNSIANLQPAPNNSPPPAVFGHASQDSMTIHIAQASVVVLAGECLASAQEVTGDVEQVPLSDLFVESGSSYLRIAGDFSETKLLNQLSLTHLGRWLKFHIRYLEPDRRVSSNVLLQMMRSVRHVVDKADWEPLVADLLQANVRGGLLHLSRLAACATSVALRRILRAGLAEVRRRVLNGDLSPCLSMLVGSPRFMEDINEALEEHCRKRALTCADAMRDLIFEQTHAVHFEQIEDIFDGCRQFESDFLSTNMMSEVTECVRDGLASRKKKLGNADIYARQLTGNISHDAIYEEVRIQFWVVKTLLGTPLTTKLYMHFVKDIKDKSEHLANEAKFQVSCESELETTLQDTLLCDSGRACDDEALVEHFAFDLAQDDVEARLNALRRVEQYVKFALEGVTHLRSGMKSSKGVDFLTRLNVEPLTSHI